MALFDYIIESSFMHEGRASSSTDTKKQLAIALRNMSTSIADINDGKIIEPAIKKLGIVSKIQYMGSNNWGKNGVQYHQHRYIVEDKNEILYQLDILSKPILSSISTTTVKIYDPSKTNIPKKICRDFIKEYLPLSKKNFVIHAFIYKNIMGIYMRLLTEEESNPYFQYSSYGADASKISSIMDKMVKKYPNDLKKISNNKVSYIG